MKKIIYGFLFALLFSAGCSENKKVNQGDAIETGREFIDASLKGNSREAKKYILPDSLNIEYFNVHESFNKNLPAKEKNGLRDASIIIDSIQNISDSVTIINYSNSFKRMPEKIKLVKIKNDWFVDFKYTFLGNM